MGCGNTKSAQIHGSQWGGPVSNRRDRHESFTPQTTYEQTYPSRDSPSSSLLGDVFQPRNTLTSTGEFDVNFSPTSTLNDTLNTTNPDAEFLPRHNEVELNLQTNAAQYSPAKRHLTGHSADLDSSSTTSSSSSTSEIDNKKLPEPTPATERINISILMNQRNHYIAVPLQAENNYNNLVAAFRKSKTSIKIFWSIFYWIADKKNTAVIQSKSTEVTPLWDIWLLQQNKHDVAALLQKLCRLCGIPCEVIAGYVKGYNYEVGDEKTLGRHRWNAVYINDHFHLLDANWAIIAVSGFTTGNWTMISDGDKQVRQKEGYSKGMLQSMIREFWVFTPPDVLIYTHLPDDPKWQLLPTPFSSQRFADLPYVGERFHEFQLQVLSHHSCIAYADNGEAYLRFLLPNRNSNVEFHYQLYLENNKNSELPRNCPITRLCFHHIEDCVVTFQIRFPIAGKFKMKIYARDLRGTIKTQQEYWWMCYYQVICLSPLSMQSRRTFPDNPVIGWGKNSKMDHYGIEQTSDTSGLIFSSNGEASVEFAHKVGQEMTAELISNEYHSRILRNFVEKDHDGSGKQTSFRVRLPEAGEYALKIFARDSTVGTQENVCNYLIRCNNERVVSKSFQDVIAVPKTRDADVLRIYPQSQPYKYIKTSNGYVCFTFKLEKPLDIYCSLESGNVDFEILQQYLQHGTYSNKLVVAAKLAEPGEYVLEIYAKESGQNLDLLKVFEYHIVSDGADEENYLPFLHVESIGWNALMCDKLRLEDAENVDNDGIIVKHKGIVTISMETRKLVHFDLCVFDLDAGQVVARENDTVIVERKANKTNLHIKVPDDSTCVVCLYGKLDKERSLFANFANFIVVEEMMKFVTSKQKQQINFQLPRFVPMVEEIKAMSLKRKVAAMTDGNQKKRATELENLIAQEMLKPDPNTAILESQLEEIMKIQADLETQINQPNSVKSFGTSPATSPKRKIDKKEMKAKAEMVIKAMQSNVNTSHGTIVQKLRNHLNKASNNINERDVSDIKEDEEPTDLHVTNETNSGNTEDVMKDLVSAAKVKSSSAIQSSLIKLFEQMGGNLKKDGTTEANFDRIGQDFLREMANNPTMSDDELRRRLEDILGLLIAQHLANSPKKEMHEMEIQTDTTTSSGAIQTDLTGSRSSGKAQADMSTVTRSPYRPTHDSSNGSQSNTSPMLPIDGVGAVQPNEMENDDDPETKRIKTKLEGLRSQLAMEFCKYPPDYDVIIRLLRGIINCQRIVDHVEDSGSSQESLSPGKEIEFSKKFLRQLCVPESQIENVVNILKAEEVKLKQSEQFVSGQNTQSKQGMKAENAKKHMYPIDDTSSSEEDDDDDDAIAKQYARQLLQDNKQGMKAENVEKHMYPIDDASSSEEDDDDAIAKHYARQLLQDNEDFYADDFEADEEHNYIASLNDLQDEVQIDVPADESQDPIVILNKGKRLQNHLLKLHACQKKYSQHNISDVLKRKKQMKVVEEYKQLKDVENKLVAAILENKGDTKEGQEIALDKHVMQLLRETVDKHLQVHASQGIQTHIKYDDTKINTEEMLTFSKLTEKELQKKHDKELDRAERKFEKSLFKGKITEAKIKKYLARLVEGNKAVRERQLRELKRFENLKDINDDVKMGVVSEVEKKDISDAYEDDFEADKDSGFGNTPSMQDAYEDDFESDDDDVAEVFKSKVKEFLNDQESEEEHLQDLTEKLWATLPQESDMEEETASNQSDGDMFEDKDMSVDGLYNKVRTRLHQRTLTRNDLGKFVKEFVRHPSVMNEIQKVPKTRRLVKRPMARNEEREFKKAAMIRYEKKEDYIVKTKQQDRDREVRRNETEDLLEGCIKMATQIQTSQNVQRDKLLQQLIEKKKVKTSATKTTGT